MTGADISLERMILVFLRTAKISSKKREKGQERDKKTKK